MSIINSFLMYKHRMSTSDHDIPKALLYVAEVGVDHPCRDALVRFVASCVDDFLITVRIQALDTIIHIKPAPMMFSEALARC